MTMLNKVYTNKEMCMKILRALPAEWNMKVTTMRETKNLTTTTTFQLFSNLKAYEFELQNQDQPKSNPQAVPALVVPESRSKKSESKGNEDLHEQMALLMKKFKKFSRYTKKFHKGKSSRRPYKKDREEEDEKKKEDQALCYNCRKSGHFKAHCPYPIVKKYTDEEKKAWKERKDKEMKKGRKAMKASDHEDEVKKKKEESSSDESRSSSSSSEEALLCLMAQNNNEEEVVWYIDSGCSRHMIWSKHCLEDFKEKDGPKVVFGGNEKPGETKGSGSIIKNGLIIKDVAFVQGLKFNLLSISQFCDKGYVVEFSKEVCKVKNEDTGLVILTGRRKKNMYVVDWSTAIGETYLVAKVKTEVSWLWHKRMSHLNFKAINKLARKGLVEGLPDVIFKKESICDSC
ncbi:hypothetical protein Dimus_039623 [Dionaea muscipula]